MDGLSRLYSAEVLEFFNGNLPFVSLPLTFISMYSFSLMRDDKNSQREQSGTAVSENSFRSAQANYFKNHLCHLYPPFIILFDIGAKTHFSGEKINFIYNTCFTLKLPMHSPKCVLQSIESNLIKKLIGNDRREEPRGVFRKHASKTKRESIRWFIHLFDTQARVGRGKEREAQDRRIRDYGGMVARRHR